MNSFLKYTILGACGLLHADSIVGIGVSAQIGQFGVNSGYSGSTAEYTSGNIGGQFGSQVGLTTTLSPTASFVPTPSSLPPGLTAAGFSLTDYSSSSTVSANLATGSTHMYSDSNLPDETKLTTLIQLNDGWTFTSTGGGPIDVTITFSLDGSIGNYPSMTNDYSQYVSFGPGTGSDLVWSSNLYPQTFGVTTNYGWVSTSITNNSLSGFDFTGVYQFNSGQDYQFFLDQQMECDFGAVCDFSNTAQIGIILPAGVTFTSDSGVFPSSQMSDAPEPACFVLLGAGLLVILRKHRRLR